jgi:hypothetical protein
LRAHILLTVNPGFERNEIVLSIRLDAMPRKVKQAHPALAQPQLEGMHSLFHILQWRIPQEGNLKV